MRVCLQASLVTLVTSCTLAVDGEQFFLSLSGQGGKIKESEISPGPDDPASDDQKSSV